MSSVLVIGSRGTRVSIHRRTLSQSIRVGVVTLSVVLILLTATVLVAYLMASNVSATKGYAIRELKQEREQYMRTGEHLTLSISDAASLSAITDPAADTLVATMVTPERDRIVFVDFQAAKVARK